MKEIFMNKYAAELKAIYEKYDMDKGVCMDILIAWFRNLNNPNKQYVYSFEGQENVELEELAKDIEELENNLVIPRLVDDKWEW